VYTWINKEEPHCFGKDVVDRMKALIRDSLHCVQEDRYHSDVIGGDRLWTVAGDWECRVSVGLIVGHVGGSRFPT